MKLNPAQLKCMFSIKNRDFFDSHDHYHSYVKLLKGMYFHPLCPTIRSINRQYIENRTLIERGNYILHR